MADINERDIEAYLVTGVKELGGFSRKLQWVGTRGAPDRIVFLNGVWFAELKTPGKAPNVVQMREHSRMRWHGAMVFVLDSYASVDNFLNVIKRPLR